VHKPEVLVVVGARPNFVKVAPLVHALINGGVEVSLLHTGQHYDRSLSDAFIEQLDLPAPRHSLRVGSATHAEQTAAVMVGVEQILMAERPAIIVVPGDVNSTMGAALAAAKLGVPVAHLEAGLRSRDWTMPEEINRVVTDRVSDLLLCHCQEAVDNLRAEGVPDEAIAFVGNTMIDSLLRLRPVADATGIVERLGLGPGGYALVTLHRPALVDDAEALDATVEVLAELAERLPVVFPVHPRTRARLEASGRVMPTGLVTLAPLEYLEFVAVEASARMVVTDSGGVQEETSALGVPCITYRDNTERAVTVELGTNRLVGVDPDALRAACHEELDSPMTPPAAPIPLWDGHAGRRAAGAILDTIGTGTAGVPRRESMDGASVGVARLTAAAPDRRRSPSPV
jgi:UDP-N-acetylglucosamine 2-epimerase (non-hydrolysing)